jgi:hypothetical protein
MRIGVAATVAAVAALLAVQTGPPSRSAGCSDGFRWPVKTLSDPLAQTVRYQPVRQTTVRSLRHVRRRWPGATTPRLAGTERRVYRVRARLVKASYTPDREIYLVIADPANRRRTLAVEFPSPTCEAVGRSRKRRAMSAARAVFFACVGSLDTGRFTRLRGTAVITGVGFHDSAARRPGTAPNRLTLHPVLGFRPRSRCR